MSTGHSGKKVVSKGVSSRIHSGNTAAVSHMETFIEISSCKNVGRTEGGTFRAILEAGLVV